MNLSLRLFLFFKLSLVPLFAYDVNTIEELDDIAAFSFAVCSDSQGWCRLDKNSSNTNNASWGRRHEYFDNWSQDHHEFIIGAGDHWDDNPGSLDELMQDDPYWNKHFYPNIADHDNQGWGSQSSWGAGWRFLLNCNIFDRNHVEFRPKGGKVRSGGSDYDDQLIDYYAVMDNSTYPNIPEGFKVHLISIHFGDNSDPVAQSLAFAKTKLVEIASNKTPKDIVVFVAHAGEGEAMLKNLETRNSEWDRGDVDFLMETADLIVDASTHKPRVYVDDNHNYANPDLALWFNAGQLYSRGYWEVHVVDSATPYLTLQHIDVRLSTTRKLQVEAYAGRYNNYDDYPQDERRAYIKYLDGGGHHIVDWNNLPEPITTGSTIPLVSVASPQDESSHPAGSSLTVTVNASDPEGISNVKLFLNNVALTRSEGSAPYSWSAAQGDAELTNLTDGYYYLKAEATDNHGYKGMSSEIAVTVGNPPPPEPAVSFIQPSNTVLTTGDNLSVDVNAVDPDGIDRVRLFMDGVELARSEGTAPYTWGPSQNDTELMNLPAGTFTLTAKATDNRGYMGETSINIMITNTGIPAVNLVLNGSFENGGTTPTSWDIGSGTVGNGEQAKEGSRSLRMSTANGNTKQVIDIVPNSNYELSFWVLGSGITAGGVRFDTDDKFDQGQTPGGTCQFVINAGDAQVWTKYTGNFYSASEMSVTLRTYDSSDFAGVAYFDDVKLINLDTPELSEYEQWVVVNDVGDPSDDDDGDGISNLMEYALGGDPKLENPNIRPQVLRASSSLDFRFKRDQASVTYTIEKSTDLLNWSDHVTVTDIHGVVGSDAMVSIPDTEMSSGKLFLRLKVEN